MRFILIITLTILFNRLSIFSNLFAQGLTEQTSQSLRQQIEPPKSSKKMAIEGEPIYALAMLRLFYQRRNFMPAWNDQGLFSSQADILIKAIYQADQEGLVPEDYHLTKIGTLVSDIRQNISQNQFKENAVNLYQWAELDLLLTDSFLTYSSHLLNGRNNPGIISAKQQEKNPQIDLALLLQSSLETNRIEETLKTLLPLESGYLELRNALAYYRQVAGSGGWPKISIKQALKIGEQGEAVKILRSRLLDNSGLSSLSEDSKNIFDKELETAVIKLQKKHGLPANGVVDSATIEVLNMPVEELIRQIKLNMERWRWLPQNLDRRYILINIADFNLDVVEEDKIILSMKVVVGRPFRNTPILSSRMEEIVINPYWYVPRKIAVEDILPIIQKNTSYLTKQQIRVFLSGGMESPEIDPKTIDWLKITAKNLNYRFRQEPGPMNPLGRIEFLFPNEFSVYLHDTPAKELFTMVDRTFSSGCIRIEKAITLAEYLFRGDPKWKKENIVKAINQGKGKTIKIPEPITIHLVYWTAWADKDGSIHFRKDIYGRDKLLEQAMQEKPAVLQ